MTFWTKPKHLAAALAIGFLSPLVASACDFNDEDGPDVALVLSGGGALAASQVGAIEVLEENEVPIHCVLGTSMGAVVGSLYAAGYDAEALQEIFIEADWGAITTGARSYRVRSFLEKEEQENYLSDYVLGIDEDGLNLPSGVSSLRNVRRYLRYWTSDLTADQSFDELPRPYRAIATDLETGEAVILSSGDLVDAAVASMTVPSLYPPEILGGRVLVDGGMSKQVPIDIARDMGADIIIVVDTTIPPPALSGQAPSITDVALRLVSLQVWNNRQEQVKLLREEDVHIRPDMTGYSTYDFSRMGDGKERGREAAMRFEARIKEIASVAAPARAPKATADKELLIASVSVSETENIDEDLIIERFEVEPGQTVTPAELQASIDQVDALGVFTSVDYRALQGPTGTDLIIDAVPRRVGNDLVQIGATFESSFDGRSEYALKAQWTRLPINRFAGQLSVGLELGSELAAEVSFRQPLGSEGRYFIEPTISYEQRNRFRVINQDINSEWRDSFGEIRLRTGRELGLWGLASIDAFAISYDPNLSVGLRGVEDPRAGEYYGVRGRFAGDTLDRLAFPTEGLFGDLRLTSLVSSSASDDALITSIRGGGATSVGSFGIRYTLDAAQLDQSGAGLAPFQLGGFKRFSGFVEDSVWASEYALGRLDVYRRLGGRIDQSFGVPIYIGGTAEIGSTNLDFSDPLADQDDIIAGSLYIAANTPIGPAHLAFGSGEGGRQAIYLSIGRTY